MFADSMWKGYDRFSENSLVVPGPIAETLSGCLENREVPNDNQTSSHLLGQNQQYETATVPSDYHCGEYCCEGVPIADAAKDRE
jgi:hypothetical protein